MEGEPSPYAYDIFLSYGQSSEDWVHDWLLARLEAASLTVCIDTRDFDVGVPTLVNLERAMAASRHIVLVLTPDWVDSTWSEFETLLLATTDPAYMRRRMLPLVLKVCQPPKWIASLTSVDFSQPDQRDQQLERLLAAVRGQLRLPELGPPLARLAPSDEPPPPEPARPPVAGYAQAGAIGREVELVFYQELLASEHAALIAGPPGVGKTTLASMLCQAEPSARIFWHSFHKAQGVYDLLWVLAAFLAWWGSEELWRMLQSARRSGGQAPPPDILLDYVEQAIRGQDYLICLDDLHVVAGDPALDALVQRLHQEARGGAFKLLMTSRVTPSFIQSPAEPLAGLGLAAAASLLAQRGLSLAQPLVETLVAQTGGNAQLLLLSIEALRTSSSPEKLVNSLQESGQIERYLMHEVDTGLSEPERAVMSAVAALLGYPASRAAIEAVMDGEKARRELHDLVERHLLLAIETPEGQLYYQHGIVQAFYYDLLSKRERLAMHQRAGEHYQSEEPDALKAAEHFHEAADHQRAVQIATADIWALINQGQARPLLALLESLADQTLEPPDRILLLISLGEIETLLRQFEHANEHFQQAYQLIGELPETASNQVLKARVCRGMGVLLDYDSPQEALEWLQRGLVAIQGLSVLEEAILHLRVGSVYIALGNYQLALKATNACLQLLPPEPSHWRATALMNFGIVHCLRGETQEGMAHYQQALEVYQQLHNYWGILAIWTNQALEVDAQGDWQGARETYLKALTLAQRLGSVRHQAHLELPLGNLALKQGDDQRAQEYLERCMELSGEHNLKEMVLAAESSLADLRLRQGALPACDLLIRDAEQRALATAIKYPLPEIYRIQALVQLAQGQPGAALELSQRSLLLAEELESALDHGLGLRVLGQAQLAQGQRDAALASFEQSAALLEPLDPYETARTRALWGRAQLDGPQSQAGLDAIVAASQRFFQLGAQRDLRELDPLLQTITSQGDPNAASPTT